MVRGGDLAIISDLLKHGAISLMADKDIPSPVDWVTLLNRLYQTHRSAYGEIAHSAPILMKEPVAIHNHSRAPSWISRIGRIEDL
jgi:hypothetical protein